MKVNELVSQAIVEAAAPDQKVQPIISKIKTNAAEKFGITGTERQFYTIFVGGSERGADKLLDKLVKAGFKDDATSYVENAEFFKALGVTKREYMDLVKASL